MTQQLSLAARSVFESFNSKFDWVEDGVPGPQFNAIAAAIRAAADQVVPEHREHYPATLDERYRKVSAFDVRNKFLAIATELEAQ